MSEIVNFHKMSVGKKGGGKHWTKDEIERRAAAAEKVQRKVPVRLRMPAWLDDAASAVWKKTLRDMAGLEILDKVDEDLLGIYCDAVARQRDAAIQGRDDVEWAKQAQSYARIIISYADKLGLNPNSRARLAKKIADEVVDVNADLFD